MHTFPTPAELLVVEGADAAAFLQSQFSSDVSSVQIMHWQFSAWLDAQGRVKTLFHLMRLEEERWLVLLRGGDAATMRDALQRYVFRSKVQIHVGEQRFITEAAAMPVHEVALVDGTLTIGCGDHALQLSAAPDGPDTWRLKQIRVGWPWLPDNLAGELLAPSLSLHRLGAVALDKGCYPGQEIIARLHYRGGNKRHLHHVELAQQLSPGTTLAFSDDARGIQLLDVVATERGSEALAVIGDALASAASVDHPLQSVDGIATGVHTSWCA